MKISNKFIKTYEQNKLYILGALLVLFAFHHRLNVYAKYLLVFVLLFHIGYVYTKKYERSLMIASVLTVIMYVLKEHVYREGFDNESSDPKKKSDDNDDADDDNNDSDNDSDDSSGDLSRAAGERRKKTYKDTKTKQNFAGGDFESTQEDSEDEEGEDQAEKFKEYRRLNKETAKMANVLEHFQKTIHGLAPTITQGKQIMKSLEKLL